MSPRSFPLLALLLGGTLSAHECWLQPSTLQPAAGEEIELQLLVGMNFQGDPIKFDRRRVVALRHFSAAGSENWTTRVRINAALPVSFETAGTHLVTYDSTASLSELPADKFAEYLRDEGLEAILAERQQRGETNRPGRERYRRCNKTILLVGAAHDVTLGQRTGQPLEIVPLVSGSPTAAPGTWRFQVLLAGQPLPGAKVRAWHRAGEAVTKQEATTSTGGEVSFELAAPGEWMISTLHMQRMEEREADWESTWANLTFGLSPPQR